MLVPVDVYKRTRQDPAHFFIFPSHAMADIERVIESTEDYQIVEKVGPGRAVAERDSLN